GPRAPSRSWSGAVSVQRSRSGRAKSKIRNMPTVSSRGEGPWALYQGVRRDEIVESAPFRQVRAAAAGGRHTGSIPGTATVTPPADHTERAVPVRLRPVITWATGARHTA